MVLSYRYKGGKQPNGHYSVSVLRTPQSNPDFRNKNSLRDLLWRDGLLQKHPKKILKCLYRCSSIQIERLQNFFSFNLKMRKKNE